VKRLGWSILLILPLGAAADVFRSVDENGVVTYSDMPSERAERIEVRAFVTSEATTTRVAQADGEAAAAAVASESEPVGEVPREATPEEIAAERERNCQIARERAEAFAVSQRLFRSLPNGEREYLSDEEITAARTNAESDVAAWCD
jgi:hypothetical protein